MLTALLIIAIILLLICLGCYIRVFFSPLPGQNDFYVIPDSEQYRPQKEMMREMIKDFAVKDFEKVEIVARDGLRLSGRCYEAGEGKTVDLCFHGYRSTSVRDFCGGAEIPLELGHGVILPDQRSHGESGGHTISFGIKERYDVLSWIDYVLCRFGEDTEINLYGISMGAATVLMAAGLELPENVKHIVADCPYSSPAGIIKKVCRDLRLPVGLVYPFIRAGALIFGRFDLEAVTAEQAVKSAKVPILLIHGEDDRFVPCEMSEEIRRANPELICRHTFPGAAHGISYVVDKPRYQTLAKDFLCR